MSEEYGQYQLVKKLATGGMAQIYLARHRGIEGFERLCVVKRILPHLAENEDFIKMFLDEAIIAARLNHPNIVQIQDLGTQDDSYFLAMEYIPGEDLRKIWKRAAQLGVELPIPVVLRVIADAAAGLDYAHKRVDNGRALNIVHRDISPQNILVSFEGAVKVVDFGIAKAVDKMSHTRSGVLKGKYSYMSPEQAAGANHAPVDHRTDIFALGIVLYELLTGTRLFKRTSDLQTLGAVMECKVAPPSEVNVRVPRDLDPVVMKALRKRPEDRYAEARELQLAIENWLVTHQQPASTAHVAEFMRSLYQDRLTEEQSVGGSVSAAPRRDSAVSRARTTPSAVRRRRSARGRSMKVAVAVAALIGVAAVAVMLLRPPPAAAVAPARVELPTPVVEALPPPAPTTVEAPSPAPVKVTFATEPAGAAISVDGEAKGLSPVELDLLPGTEVAVRAELAGHRAEEHRVKVGEAASQREQWALSRLQRTVPASDRAQGSVRFVITPVGAWADVTCGNHKLGATPFGDKQLPPGVYECTFTNPELGTRRERVEVRPNDLSKVTVKFEPGSPR